MKDAIKSDWTLRKCFEVLRMANGSQSASIVLTLEQQEEICKLVENFYKKERYEIFNTNNKRKDTTRF